MRRSRHFNYHVKGNRRGLVQLTFKEVDSSQLMDPNVGGIWGNLKEKWFLLLVTDTRK